MIILQLTNLTETAECRDGPVFLRAPQREDIEMNAGDTVRHTGAIRGLSGRLAPGRRVAGWGASGRKGCLPPGRRVAGWEVSGGGAVASPAAHWRGGGVPGGRAALPPAFISGSFCVAFSLNDIAGEFLSTDARLTTSGAARGRLHTGLWVAECGGRCVAG